jgi:predicted DNA-binding transcriptional regulator AlpA
MTTSVTVKQNPHPNRKLTRPMIAEARRLHRAGMTWPQIARHFGVSIKTVYERARVGRAGRHDLAPVEGDLLARAHRLGGLGDAMNPDRLLSLIEVCHILNVQPSWCYNNKQLPWVKVGKLKRLWESDLNDYLKARRQPPKGYHVIRPEIARNPNAVIEVIEAMD